MEQVKVLDLYGLRPRQVDEEVNQLLEDGFKLISLSNIEMYQGVVDWGMATFIKEDSNENKWIKEDCRR